MVVLKRVLDYRFNDHNSPTVPRAPRSIRRKSNHKSPQTSGICAFELLAAVAGKLLEESECSSASSSAAVGFDQCKIDRDSIKKEQQDVYKPLGAENDDQGSSEGSVFFSGLQRDVCKGKLETVGEANGEHASPFASSACSMKLDFDSKLAVHKNPCEFVKLSGIREESSPKCGEADDAYVEKCNNKNPALSGDTSGDFTMTNKSPASTNCKEKVELPLFRDSNSNATFCKLGNNVNIGCKDDDENVSLDSQPHRKVKVCNSKTHTGDKNMRKILTSNLWSTAPKLKDYEKSDMGGAVKLSSQNKRCHYEMDGSKRNSPFKKRRFLDRSSVVTYDGGISCESVSNSPEKSMEIEKNASSWKLHEEKGISSSEFGHQKPCDSNRSDVRLRIKSFKVPELFIEVPQSTTVCSLKKTVLEAVTSILGGGLRVGVLLHGKNIQDDNKTLFQTGISLNDNVDSVAFILEPDSPTHPSQFKCSEDPPALSPDSPKFVNRSLDKTNEDVFHSDQLADEKPLMTDCKWPNGSSCDFIPSHCAAVEKIGSDSKALVPVPKANTELALMPVNPRPKRGEIGQRRARRPFSVSEVEALVQAVEKLGTGRWRDVKLCAFEDAKHRTYVDLKDKWKTLVHTARISPQQRRGEPVPQELLDRVLKAQAHWSDHQAKQHGKQQHVVVPKLTDCTTVKA